jgi:hypothetical protein
LGTINCNEIDDERCNELGRVGLLARVVKCFPHWQAISYEMVIDLMVVLTTLDNNK